MYEFSIMSTSNPDIKKFPDAALQRYVETQILPQYRAFDKAHQEDHARKVIEESLKLAAHYDVDVRMVYTVAAYHDLGLVEGRETHHIVSGKILMADNELKKYFTVDELITMKNAIEDHRASSDHEPRSLYGRIVAEADRDIEPMRILRRTVQYGLSRFPEKNHDEQYARFVSHLHEKYAEGGYLKLWIPESGNAAQLSALRDIIRDEEALKACFERIYMEETTTGG